jgi:hypothetical protein
MQSSIAAPLRNLLREGKEGGSPLAKLKSLNSKASKHPVIRQIKIFVYFCLAVYTFVTTLIEFAGTFEKNADFQPDPTGDRCVTRFYEAAEYAKAHNAIMGYWVTAGTKRIAVCSNRTDAVLDADFSDMVPYDPVFHATDGACSIDSPTDMAVARTMCAGISPCAPAFDTEPVPRGLAWAYTVRNRTDEPPSNFTTPPSLPSNNGTTPTSVLIPAPPSAPSNHSATPSNITCALQLEKNDLPECPFGNVRFFEHTSPGLTLLYFSLALWSVGVLSYERVHLGKFTNDTGDHFGDLRYMIAPTDGVMGAIYTMYRVVRGMPQMSELPDPSWIDFGRNTVGSLLSLGVSISALWGCSFTWNLPMFFMCIFSSLKFVYDTVMYLKPKLFPGAQTAKGESDTSAEMAVLLEADDGSGSPTGSASPTVSGKPPNDTPLPSNDDEGVAMYRACRDHLCQRDNGQWPAILAAFAQGSPKDRLRVFAEKMNLLPPHMRSKSNATIKEIESLAHREMHRVCEVIVENEKPKTCFQTILPCLFTRREVPNMHTYLSAEHDRVLAATQNKYLDAFLARRTIIAKLSVIDLLRHGLEGNSRAGGVAATLWNVGGGAYAPPPAPHAPLPHQQGYNQGWYHNQNGSAPPPPQQQVGGGPTAAHYGLGAGAFAVRTAPNTRCGTTDL